MLQTNELRIGNAVLFNGEEITMTVDEFHNWLHADAEPGRYEGLPITAESLLRIGFIKESDVDEDGTTDFYNYKQDSFYEMSLYQQEDGRWSMTVGEIDIEHYKYIHQLQNLFFAVNNMEMNPAVTT